MILQFQPRNASPNNVAHIYRANLVIHPAMSAAQVRHLLNGRRLVARPEPKEVA